MNELQFSNEDDSPAEPVPDVSGLYHKMRIDHPDTFISQLTGITAPWQAAWGVTRPWFRGMPRLSFSLEPSLLRYRPRRLVATESNLRNQFQQYAVRLLDKPPASQIDLLTIMQHHGVPTRLLDWSENAFAALYFAVKEHQFLKDAEDAVVWVLDPLRLAELQHSRRYIPFWDDQLLSSPRLPIPLYPRHMSTRLTPQRAAFTIHPFGNQHSLMNLALQEVREGRLSPLRALVIQGDKRTIIRDAMLNALGSGEFTFFPDLDGLGRELRMREGLEGRG